MRSEQKQAQAARCPCKGTDDYCPCQNVPTRRGYLSTCGDCGKRDPCDDNCPNSAGPTLSLTTQSAPVFKATQKTAESDPPAKSDCAGADTSSPLSSKQ